MVQRLKWVAFAATALAAGAALVAGSAMAADHGDGAAVAMAPEADINDVYTWVDADTLKLIMTVHPFADSGSAFSDNVQYVFHVGSAGAALAPPSVSVNVICQFDASQSIECFVSDGEAAVADYVAGDASDPSGITSMSGDTRVFAGLVNDPFYFYLDGFTAARSAVLDFATNTLDPMDVNAGGCPDLTAYPGTGLALRNALSGDMGANATNNFAAAQVLAISIELNKELVTKGGTNVSVWSSTHNRGN